MSILAFAVLSDDQAVVMVDTETGRGRETSKLLPLPHLGAVVAGRGNAGVLSHTALLLNAQPTFQAAAGDLGEALDWAVQQVTAFLEQNGIDPKTADLADQQLALVGSADGKATAVVAERRDGGQATVTVAATSLVAPGVDDERAPALLTSDIGAVLLARMQVEAARAVLGDDVRGFGGRCIVARISTRPSAEITIRDLGAIF